MKQNGLLLCAANGQHLNFRRNHPPTFPFLDLPDVVPLPGHILHDLEILVKSLLSPLAHFDAVVLNIRILLNRCFCYIRVRQRIENFLQTRALHIFWDIVKVENVQEAATFY